MGQIDKGGMWQEGVAVPDVVSIEETKAVTLQKPEYQAILVLENMLGKLAPLDCGCCGERSGRWARSEARWDYIALSSVIKSVIFTKKRIPHSWRGGTAPCGRNVWVVNFRSSKGHHW
jgi:hypothetical protein